jgi:uncharacterized OsmC-like protein
MARSTVPFVVHAQGSGVAQTLTAKGDVDHTFHSDTLPAFGGADAAPSPLSYTLGSLAACHQVTGSLVARDLGLRLGEWRVEVQGDLDPSVIAAGADGNANFDRVTVRVSLESDATGEQFARLRAETERRCPVTQMFVRSGLAFDSTWEQRVLSAA